MIGFFKVILRKVIIPLFKDMKCGKGECLKLLILGICFFFSGKVSAQQVIINPAEIQIDASFRGLSVVNDKLIWISGSNGWVGKSTDGGITWKFSQVKNFETFDFRSIYAFDANKVIIANAGSPAHILITNNGGITWEEMYSNNAEEAFFDGVDFWDDKNGIIYGDPVKGRMLILTTANGGRTWKEIPENKRPLLEEGEASFAASGTTIRCFGKSHVAIATGGKLSRIWISNNRGKGWKSFNTPILQGASSQGVFSMAWKDDRNVVITGGDFTKDQLKEDHVFFSRDGGISWQSPEVPTNGYRSSVEYISKEALIATGTSGTDISYDSGKTWQLLSADGYHVVRKARYGKLVIIAGSKGRIGVVELKKRE
jgi:photosystem II stability/assembly factor-like uncharacterized protein